MSARSLSIGAAIALIASAPSLAGGNSAPQPAPAAPGIAASQDVDYPGTMRLDIDVTDIERAIWRVKQSIPVARSGRMTLLMPAWIPGAHAPVSAVEKLAGLRIQSNGKPVPWTRDAVNPWAFHVDVPEGGKPLDIQFEFLSATAPDQGRIEVAPNMMNLRFESVSLYPAGYFTRRIPVALSVTYPEGWHAASAMPSRKTGNVYRYDTVSYETLIDSPVFAGRHARKWALSDRVDLETFADRPDELAATPAQIDAHRKLVEQSIKLFGAQPYDRYTFLLAITDEMGGIGLEHHRSSENGVKTGYFTRWDDGPGSRNLLPHELVHSWNGKYRRAADSWTADFHTPMRSSLLWVYEGQTQFWGFVLQARAGLVSKKDTFDQIAMIAAGLDNRPGRQWRPLLDTTNDPVIANRRPKGWVSWQRAEDYYNEGLLVWLEVDALLRKLSGGAKSMDDFAAAFFRGRDGDWGTVTYTAEDVVATLAALQPHDWAGFFARRIERTSEGAPLDGVTGGGYRLAFSDVATPAFANAEKAGERTDLTHSLGIAIGKAGIVQQVIWDSPAFAAGLTASSTIVAVNGVEYSPEALKRAITAAKGDPKPIQLLVKKGTQIRPLSITYRGGLRYPYLERVGDGPAGLDRLLTPR